VARTVGTQASGNDKADDSAPGNPTSDIGAPDPGETGRRNGKAGDALPGSGAVRREDARSCDAQRRDAGRGDGGPGGGKSGSGALRRGDAQRGDVQRGDGGPGDAGRRGRRVRGDKVKLDRKVLIVFPGLMLGMLLAALDQTIVATSLPTIVTDLGGLTHLPWVATSYLLASCVSTPIYGKLGDIYGRKRLFQGAIVLFLIGSALCGTARSMDTLIAFRALQGVGAGGLMVNSQAIIGDLVPPAERGRYQGFMQSVFAFSTVAGPLIGGLLTQGPGWRWVFYVNIPIGVVALVVVAAVLKLPPRKPERPSIDWLGAGLLSTGVASVILVTSWGGTTYPWLSTPIIGLSCAGVALLSVFVLVERRAEEPLLPLRLFRSPVLRVSIPLIFVVGFGMVGVATFNPLYQQVVDGVSPTMSGLRLSPMVLSMMVTSVVCGRTIARIGRYRKFPIVGTFMLIIGMFLLSRLQVGTPYGFQFLALVVVGVSLGLVNPVLVLAAQNAVQPGDIGVATSTNTFGRTVGSSFGVAVFGAIFSARLTSGLSQGPTGRVVGRFSSGGLNISRAQINALPPALRTGFLDGFAHALHGVFLGGTVVAVIGFLLALRLREVPLRRRPGTPAPPVAPVGQPGREPVRES
jgi:EmrB/QacA subfamily drug resistance transporter